MGHTSLCASSVNASSLSLRRRCVCVPIDRPLIDTHREQAIRGNMKLLYALGVLLFACASLFAQSGGTAQISGTIHDPSGSAVPGAHVNATQSDTRSTR